MAQFEVLDIMRELGGAATVKEIAEAARSKGLWSRTPAVAYHRAQGHLERLRVKGQVKRESGRWVLCT